MMDRKQFKEPSWRTSQNIDTDTESLSTKYLIMSWSISLNSLSSLHEEQMHFSRCANQYPKYIFPSLMKVLYVKSWPTRQWRSRHTDKLTIYCEVSFSVNVRLTPLTWPLTRSTLGRWHTTDFGYWSTTKVGLLFGAGATLVRPIVHLNVAIVP